MTTTTGPTRPDARPAPAAPAPRPSGSPSAPARPDAATLRRGVRLLGRAVREQPGIFAVSVGGSAVYGVATVGQAAVLGRVTDRVILPALAAGRTTYAALVAAFAAIVAVSLLRAAGVVARRLGAGVLQYRMISAYRRRVTRQYLRLPLSWHARHPTGQLLSNANADVEASWAVLAPLPMALGVLIMLVTAGAAMLATDPVLALVGFLVFPAIFAVNVAYQRRLSPLATRAQQLRAEVSGIAHESFEGALVVKTLGREAAETERFRAAAERLRDAQVAVGRVRGVFDPLMEALPGLGVLAVLLLGTARIEQGALGTGELVRVAYLFTVLAFPVRAIGWVLGELPRSLVGWERVTAVLGAGAGMAYGERELPRRGPAAPELRAVSFRYGEVPGDPAPAVASPAVVEGVTLDVAPGRTVAVVGPTGSGKSTLASLLVRLVDPGTGEVLLDGTDLREVRRGGVAATAALVPQHAFLFDDSVRDNVTLGLDAGDEEVRAALVLAQAEGFVDALPAGLDTRVGERGATLSGGQRQRIALARALVRRPRLLVLDDATSSVDPRVEAAILGALRAAYLPTTLVLVAYRQATIALADEVVYLERGRVLDRGAPAELLVRCPGYHRLVTAYERAEQLDRAADRPAAEAAGVA